MNLQKKDVIATVLVAAAGVLYLLWVSGSSPAALDGVRATGTAILVLGFAASATAVVPGFTELMHGNRIYMAVTSLIGLGAAVAGGLVLLAESEGGLAVLMAAMLVLWLVATIHHSLLAKVGPPAPAPRSL